MSRLEGTVLERPANALRAAWTHPRWGPLVKVVVAYVVLVEIVVQVIFGRIDVPLVHVGFLELGRKAQSVPRGVFVTGAVVGTLYALVGIGLILIYRASRIINFAQAALGSVPAVAALILLVRKGYPYPVAFAIAIVGGALLGALVDVAIMRRFRDSPRLIATVATIGVAQLLAFIEFYVPKLISGQALAVETFKTPFSSWSFHVGVIRFTGDHVFTLVVVGAIVLGLGAFFRYTDMGIAVRASAENGPRASLLGIPVKRVATVVWVIAAVLSATGVFLRAPLVGLPIGGLIGPSVLLFGLAAAVIARMESLPVCLVAGMFIGIVDQTAVFSTNRASLATAAMLVVILVALLAQRGALSRAYEMGSSTFQTVKEYRPVPAELRGTQEVIVARMVLSVVVLGLLIGLPVMLSDSLVGQATQVVMVGIIGVSLVVLTGWAGQISLGQYAIAGVGAAVAGGLATRHTNFLGDFFVTLVLAGLAGALVAVLIGLPALRIQGLFLAVTTLALAFAVQAVVLNPEYFGWLLPPEGFTFVERPVLYGFFSTDTPLRWYYVCLALLGLVMLAARALRKNAGRLLLGARDNSRVVQSFGVNLARTRLTAFAISGFMAAIGGALIAYEQRAVNPGVFSPLASVGVFSLTVIGGLTSVGGALIGAVYVIFIPYLLKDTVERIDLLSTGVGLLILLLVLPGGLSEAGYRVRDRFLRWTAHRRNIHVPSLVADSRVDQEAGDHAIGAAERRVLAAPLAGRASHADVLSCPECGALVPMDEAKDHEHFQLVGSGAGDE